jgi:hypothetical protein
MKLICEITLPDNADLKTKLDAMAKAGRDESMWRTVMSREGMVARTSLENKCGSCKYFKPFNPKERPYLASCGECDVGHVWGARTRKACKQYERKNK